MKKILAITPFFYPHLGGSEAYMEGLYSYLKENNPDLEIDVLCYNSDKAKEKEVYRGLNIYRIPCFTILPGQFILPRPLPLIKFLRKHRDYDLVNPSTRFFDSSWWAPLYAKMIGARLVLTDHCAYHPVSSNKTVNLFVKLIEATIVRFSLNFYSEVLVENKKTKEFLKKNFNTDSKVAYPGLFEDVKVKRGENKRLKVIYVGRLIESKGVRELLEASKEFKEVDFIFAGDGSLLGEFKKEARKLNNLKVLGAISRIEVMKLLKTSDIFAYPTWHSEGLPLALVQAGQAGIAVVATDCGAIGEIIKDGDTGILVKPADSKAFTEALVRLIVSRKLRTSLGNNLKDFTLKTFSWEKASNLIIQNLN